MPQFIRPPMVVSFLVAAFSTLSPSAVAQSPDVLFHCDFESDAWWTEWSADQRDPHTDTVESDITRKFEVHDGKALRIRVDEGGHYGASLQYRFKKRTGSEPEEIL